MTEKENGLHFPAPHPGEILKFDVLPELNMTIAQFAEHLGVKRAGLSELLNGKKPVTQDMAIRLGKALGTGTRYWLAMQLQYDLDHDLPLKAAHIDVSPVLDMNGTAA